MRAVLVAVLVSLCAVSAAEAQSYEWTGTDGQGHQCSGDLASVQACFAGYAYGVAPSGSPTYNCPDVPTQAGQTCTAEVDSQIYQNGQLITQFMGGIGISATSATGPCPVGQDADALGNGSSVTISQLKSGGYCANGCEYRSVPTTLDLTDGTHYAIGGATSTGNSCSSGEPTVSLGNNCFSSHGETLCVETTGGFATINNDSVPVGSGAPNQGQCVMYDSGGSLCVLPHNASTMPTPPAPDNGTPGNPATPTVTASQNGNTVNYYSSSTVANSSTPVLALGNSDGSNAGKTAPSSGSTSAGGGGAASAAQPDDCSTNNCVGTVPTLPTQQDISTTTQNYWTALNNAPIVQAFAGIQTALSTSAGECPTYTLSMFGHEYVMDQQCTMMNNMAGVLGAVMLAIYTLAGVRILMSA